ncbi:MAG: MFS transporter [Deltaproteobacteria bacterium]|nr:MFS transporter [Deltaproteobacteria bacterium]
MKDTRSARPAAQPARPEAWGVIALAGVILMITMGIRQTVGLFVHPLAADKTMSIAEISMALAVGQLLWGVFQPLCGIWADKRSAFTVLWAGALLLAAGQLLTLRASGLFGLTLAQGILSPAGAAAGSFSVLFGIVAARLPSDKRSVAGGLINAGGSAGQCLFAPVVQYIMYLRDYSASLIFLAGTALATILPARFLCAKPAPHKAAPASALPVTGADALSRAGLREQLATALRTPSYLLLHAGFFTCGFHVAFLTTHLPGEISLCGHSASVSATSIALIGFFNIGGSIMSGILGKYFRMKYILAAMYGSRAVTIALYLLAPKTEAVFYVFAVLTGITWLATVPPTAGLVGKLFGTRYLATLFGLALLSHQVGAFLGAWLGGVAVEQSGNLLYLWYADMLLALFAAFVNLPIKEEK